MRVRVHLTARTIDNPGVYMPHRLVFDWPSLPSMSECLRYAYTQGLDVQRVTAINPAS